MIRSCVRSLLMIAVISVCWQVAFAQPQLVAPNASLPYYLPGTEKIAIAILPSDGPEILWLRNRHDFSYDMYLARKDLAGNWESEFKGVFSAKGLNLWAGKESSSFIYFHFGNELYFSNDDTLQSRATGSQPAMDSLGCFHLFLLSRIPERFIYKFSRDTLRTFEFVDTLIADVSPIGVIASPNRGQVGLFYRNYNVLYKCLGVAGQPLNIHSSTTSDFDYEPDDIAIDNTGNTFIAYHRLGEITWERYVWSEQYGSRRFYEIGDPSQNGTVFQLAFCPSRNAVIGIESDVYGSQDAINIIFSTDYGDSWNLSQIHPQYGNASTPRLVGDTLYLAMQKTDSMQVYFQAEPIYNILLNAESVDETTPIPTAISLSSYPNPFNSQTTISFSLAIAGQARLSIYDISGRLVTTLLDGYTEVGPHNLVWAARNKAGKPLSSGIFFARLEASNSVYSRRLIFLK